MNDIERECAALAQAGRFPTRSGASQLVVRVGVRVARRDLAAGDLQAAALQLAEVERVYSGLLRAALQPWVKAGSERKKAQQAGGRATAAAKRLPKVRTDVARLWLGLKLPPRSRIARIERALGISRSTVVRHLTALGLRAPKRKTTKR